MFSYSVSSFNVFSFRITSIKGLGKFDAGSVSRCTEVPRQIFLCIESTEFHYNALSILVEILTESKRRFYLTFI